MKSKNFPTLPVPIASSDQITSRFDGEKSFEDIVEAICKSADDADAVLDSTSCSGLIPGQ